MLEADPGNYEGARRMLHHKNSDTTCSSYEGMETRSAVNRFDEIIRDLRGDVAAPPRKRRYRHRVSYGPKSR